MSTVGELREEFCTKLQKEYEPEEARRLFALFYEEYTGSSMPILHRAQAVPEEIKEKFDKALLQLIKGQPFQQILGYTFFYHHKFLVNEHTLIPRPETEELVDLALNTLPKEQKLSVLDIGTGSGCIAISLAIALPKATVTAMEISEQALQVALKNAELLGAKVNFQPADYLSTRLTSTYDVLISNPPYIAETEQKDLDKRVKDFEPDRALFAHGMDPLIFYRKMAADTEFLNSGAYVFLEINQKLGIETRELFEGKLSEVRLVQDISGNDRFIIGRK